MTDTPHPADWAEYHAHMEDEDELDRLRAENERLREALEEIVAMAVQWEPLTPGDIAMARKALEAPDED